MAQVFLSGGSGKAQRRRYQCLACLSQGACQVAAPECQGHCRWTGSLQDASSRVPTSQNLVLTALAHRLEGTYGHGTDGAAVPKGICAMVASASVEVGSKLGPEAWYVAFRASCKGKSMSWPTGGAGFWGMAFGVREALLWDVNDWLADPATEQALVWPSSWSAWHPHP